ncbi:MAG: PAS domain S-box protein [Planctomycetes bacterium]|nr:PAS domain S-box protein [Planctomycetota bacterium]
MTPPADISTPSESDALEVLLIDGSGFIIALSMGAAKYLGRPQRELQGRSLSEVFPMGVHPAFPWLDQLSKSGSPLPPLLLDLEHTQADEASVHVEGVLYAIEVGLRSDGETVAGLAIRPSTSFAVENELLTAQRQILQLAAQRATLPDTLDAVATFSEKVLPSEVFCLLTPVSEQGDIGSGLRATLPGDIRGLLASFQDSPDAAPGLVARSTGKMVVANELDQDPRWKNYSKRLRSHGLVTVWSVPICDSRKSAVRAILEFHLPVRRGPNRAELKVIEELSALVRLAIDLHQLQADLDLSESSLRSTIQAIPLILWQTDREGRFTVCEGKGLASLGLKSGDVVGQKVEEILRSDPNAKIHVQKALAGESVAGELIAGTTRFIQSAGPLRDEAGAIVGARGIALDVTAQRQAEAAAEATGDLLKTVVDTALDALVTIDVEGKIVLWNKQAELLFGWSSAEAKGMRLEETIIPPDLVKAHQEGMRRYHAEGVGPILGKRIEIMAMNRAGTKFPVELAVSPHAGKYVGGFSAFIRDISDRRRSETAVKASEERLKLVIEASTDGFWDYRLDGGMSVVSDRCSTMLGYKSGEAPVSTPDVNPLIHPDDAPRVKQSWQEHLAGKTPRYESEHRRRASDGSWRWVLDRGKVVERVEGMKAVRVTGTQTDITERRGLEASLGAAERMESLGLLASGFAQELDSVLSVIRAHASLANITTGVPAKAVESLEVIQLAVARAKAMSRNLILLGEGGEVGEPPRPIVVSDAVREAVRLLAPNLPRTITVAVEDLTDGRERVAVDSSRLQQAILNLLMRASEALANNGMITMRIAQTIEGSEPLVRVECVDRGAPLSADQQQHAFDALAPDGSLRGRTAMGLAAVKRFAESAGGHAQVSSTAEGTVFCLSIPAARESYSQERLPIVLAESHPLLRPMLVEALQASGHRVVTVESDRDLEAAVRRMGSGCVVVLDEESVTGQSGAILKKIKASLKTMPPVILLVSAAAEEVDLGVPASRLQKPFMFDSLLNEIMKTAGQPT